MRSAATPTRTMSWFEQDLYHWMELVKDNCSEGYLIEDAEALGPLQV